MPGRAAGRTSNTGFRCCASGCRSRRRWRTGSTAIPRACLVLGRHQKALRRLGRLFAEGQVEKVYWAVVSGVPRESEGRIEAALLKQPRGTVGWRMVVDPQGQKAVTDYRVLGAADGRAWLELRPRTGRTHQIRVHCAALGSPIVGDPAYGGPADHKLQLHARAIALPLYPAKPPVAVTAPVPPHMLALLQALGWRDGRGRFGAECGGVSEAGITIRRLSPEDAALFRDIRLEGLRRDPDAFSSTFEDESGKELSFFAERLDRLGRVRCVSRRGTARGRRVLCPARSEAPAQGHAVGHVCPPAGARGRNRPAGWSRRSSSMRAFTSS